MIKVDAEWQMSQPPIQNKGKLQHVAVFNQTQRSPSPSPRTLAPGTRRHTLARPLGPGGAASLAPNSGSGVKTNLAPLHLAGWPHDLQSRGVGLSQRPEDPKSDLGGTGKDRTGRRPSQGASRQRREGDTPAGRAGPGEGRSFSRTSRLGAAGAGSGGGGGASGRADGRRGLALSGPGSTASAPDPRWVLTCPPAALS